MGSKTLAKSYCFTQLLYHYQLGDKYSLTCEIHHVRFYCILEYISKFWPQQNHKQPSAKKYTLLALWTS